LLFKKVTGYWCFRYTGSLSKFRGNECLVS
jgi:hypothetical protein